MGYSCTALADLSREAMFEEGNTYRGRFVEQGREQPDGSVTGQVFWMDGRRAGSIRIEPDGYITRWPGSTAQERRRAEEEAVHKHIQLYGFPQVREGHGGHHLTVASFVIV